MADLLLIEDDFTFVQILESFLVKNGHAVKACSSLKEAKKLLSENTYDLLLLDYRLPDGTGLECMSFLKQNGIRTPVIMMTSFHDIRTAVQVIRDGALDYITKPVNPDELILVLNAALDKKPKEETEGPEGYVEGSSDASGQLHEHIALVAPTNMSVLILGESGTGKEQAARRIHSQSKRAAKPFIAVDCGALSPELAASELFGHVKGAFTGAVYDKKGQFELASGGTLFLDEVGNLNYEVQVKLLRVLQEKMILPVGGSKSIRTDVRIIVATNDDLVKSMENGSFREDLYHRLNEFRVKIPPLRERTEDLPKFAEHFIHVSNAELHKAVKGFSDKVLTLFRRYDWPGNLRELKNVTRRAVLLAKGSIADIDVLPEEMLLIRDVPKSAEASDLKALQEQTEREMIEKVLKEVRYNKVKAAKILNIDRKTLYMKMARYGIS